MKKFVYLLIFLLVSCGSVLGQTVEPETLYGKALETLESLEPRQPVFPEDARTGQQQETHSPVVWRVVGYLFRHYVSGFLPDWLTFGGRTRPSPPKRQQPAASSEELMGKSQGIDPKDIPSISPSDSKSLKRAKAVRLLELAGYQMGHQPSLMTLGNLFLFSDYGNPRNATTAFKHLATLANHGNATAQRIVGLMYATSVGVTRDYAKAHLYMGFAVLGGDLLAGQTLGYWHNAGIAAIKSCEEAAFYYSRIGEQVVKNFRAGPPLGRTLPPFKPSLPEVEAGGLYGPGVSGPGDPNFKQSVMKTSQALSTKDIIEYYALQADGGDGPAQLLVGQVYYQGTDGVPINYGLARKYLYMAAKQLSALKTAKGMKGLSEKRILGGQAASYLGQMYWRGEGVEQNNMTARKWFEKGAEVKNALCLNALGIMHEEGIAGFEKNTAMALHYFTEAAARDNPDALIRMAEQATTNPLQVRKAFSQVQKAANKGYIPGQYLLALHYLKGTGVTQNCILGVTYLKSLAEKAYWHDPYIHTAHQLYELGDYEGSLVNYLFAAELGHEAAQSNAAWILDKDRIPASSYPLVFHSKVSSRDRFDIAYPLWNRAANQGNVDARVKIGDYFYYSKVKGMSGKLALDGSDQAKKRPEDNYKKAAAYYRVAAENERSALAMWNIAYMYENGLGLERDFHLAKRMYDMCLATNSGGYVPVQLALTKLYFKWVYMWLTGQSKSGNPFTPQVEDLAQVQRKKVSPPSQPRGAPTTEDDDMDDILSLTDDFEDDDGLGENSLILFLALVGAFLLYWRHRVAEPPVPLPAPAGGPVPIFQQQEEPRQAPRNSVPLVQTEQAEEEPLLREELMPDSQGETLLRERRPFVRDAEEEQQDEDDQDDRKSAGHLS